MLSREDYRKIKSMSKEEMDRWLKLEHSMMQTRLTKIYEQSYKDELEHAISNFLITIAYTLHYSECVQLKQDELASFMDDLFVSVDLFRRGEYKPEDYAKELEADGIQFKPYNYSRIYDEYKAIQDRKVAELKEQIAKTLESIGPDTDIETVKDMLSKLKDA